MPSTEFKSIKREGGRGGQNGAYKRLIGAGSRQKKSSLKEKHTFYREMHEVMGRLWVTKRHID
jgi:hypothetical protein